MNQCKQCGASLPKDSNICLQCGTENAPPANDTGNTPKKELDFLTPALAGGAFLGVLSSLPYIMYGNVLCCMWIWGGGALATFLLNKQRPGGLTYGDGAMVGVFSGVFGAIVGTLIGIPVRLIQLTPERFAQIQSQMDQAAQMPPWLKDMILNSARPGINLTVVLFGLLFGIVLDSIFALIGGCITVAILNRKKTD